MMADEDTALPLSIKQWAEDDRPREKLMLKGRTALSDAELIAVLIGSGTREQSAVDLAKKVLAIGGNNLHEIGRLSLKDLKKVKGIGTAKAITIISALEIGRRRKSADAAERVQVITSRDAFTYLEPLLSDHSHEEFWTLLLNRSNRIIRACRISSGGTSGTVADTKMIFKSAIEELASSLILCHNHPSGNVKPSDADVQLTKKLAAAGQLLDIRVVDHLIVGDRTYFSFSDEGMM